MIYNFNTQFKQLYHITKYNAPYVYKNILQLVGFINQPYLSVILEIVDSIYHYLSLSIIIYIY